MPVKWKKKVAPFAEAITIIMTMKHVNAAMSIITITKRANAAITIIMTMKHANAAMSIITIMKHVNAAMSIITTTKRANAAMSIITITKHASAAMSTITIIIMRTKYLPAGALKQQKCLLRQNWHKRWQHLMMQKHMGQF